MDKTLLQILFGEASELDKFEMYKHLAQDRKKEQRSIELYTIWVASCMKSYNPDRAEVKQQFESFWQSRKRQNGFTPKRILLAAASIVVAVVVGAALLLFQKSATEVFTLYASKGNIAEVRLKDGSRIWLNSASKANIRCEGGKKVEVVLTGEAFFDIKHDKERVLIVKAGGVNIRDCGTQFNVKAYSSQNTVQVALFQGGVEVYENRGMIASNLKNNQSLTYDLKTRKVTIADARFVDVTGWKDGRFIFENESIVEIIKQLEEWYNIKFHFAKTANMTGCYTGIIQHKTDIRDLLRILALSTNIKYKITEVRDGSLDVTFY